MVLPSILQSPLPSSCCWPSSSTWPSQETHSNIYRKSASSPSASFLGFPNIESGGYGVTFKACLLPPYTSGSSFHSWAPSFMAPSVRLSGDLAHPLKRLREALSDEENSSSRSSVSDQFMIFDSRCSAECKCRVLAAARRRGSELDVDTLEQLTGEGSWREDKSLKGTRRAPCRLKSAEELHFEAVQEYCSRYNVEVDYHDVNGDTVNAECGAAKKNSHFNSSMKDGGTANTCKEPHFQANIGYDLHDITAGDASAGSDPWTRGGDAVKTWKELYLSKSPQYHDDAVDANGVVLEHAMNSPSPFDDPYMKDGVFANIFHNDKDHVVNEVTKIDASAANSAKNSAHFIAGMMNGNVINTPLNESKFIDEYGGFFSRYRGVSQVHADDFFEKMDSDEQAPSTYRLLIADDKNNDAVVTKKSKKPASLQCLRAVSLSDDTASVKRTDHESESNKGGDSQEDRKAAEKIFEEKRDLSIEQKIRMELNKAAALARRNMRICEDAVIYAQAQGLPFPKFESLLVEKSWMEVLRAEFQKPYMERLQQFVSQEAGGRIPIYPPPAKLFNAFNSCPFDKVKVVIIGQDPYHGPGQAMGLCFSVEKGIKLPSSLTNIFTEIESDLQCDFPSHGNLEKWTYQGVLLLNTVLTVRDRHANSHAKKGWELFTDAAIRALAQQRSSVVFLLWGNQAQEKLRLINKTSHHILKASHPSGISAHKGFFKCRHFSKTNKFLVEQKLLPIDWQL